MDFNGEGNKLADVVEAVLKKDSSKTSLASQPRDGEDAPNFGLKHRLGFARFKQAAVKSLRLLKQHKLIFDDQLKIPEIGRDLLSSSSNQTQPEYEEQSNEEYVKSTFAQNSSDAVFHDPSKEELQKACRVALKTHFDLRFLQSEKENQESIKYITELFSKMPGLNDRLKEAKVEASKSREIAIKCELIRGSGLLARDADGTSDPYCKMVILDKKHIDTKVVQKGVIDAWIKDGVVEKASVVKSTVKPSTLEPVWGEWFELKLRNPEEEYLVIEVWDSDEDDRTKKAKGFKGIGRLIHDLKNEDDFMGRAFYLLKHVPVGGGERELELFSHSKKHNRGTLTVRLNIVEKGKVSISEDEKFEQYQELLKVIIAHESKKGGDLFVRIWNGQLTESAEKLLTQHLSLWKLSELRAAAIRLTLFMDYHKSYAISMSALERIINEIRKFDSELKEARTTSPPDWIFQLLRDVQELHSDLLSIMKIHLERFSFKSASDIQELKAYLLTLKAIYSSSVFLNEQDRDKDFTEAVISAIQCAVPTWFLMLSYNLMPQLSSSDDKMVAFKALCAHCLKQCQRVIDGVQPVFAEVGIDYFSPFFFALDKLLYTEGEGVLNRCWSDTCILMSYEVYRLVHDLKPFVEHVDQKFLKSQSASKLYISSFYQWFKEFVPEWIILAQNKAKERLSTAVELDTVVKYTDRACFSSSAVDAHSMFIQVISFWKDLDWPDREQSLGYFVTIVQNISELAIHYADLMFQKLKPEDYVDEGGKFVITDKLCIALNNISHVKEVILEDIGNDLGLVSYYKWLDEEEGEKGSQQLSKKAEELRKSLLDSADEDMQNKKNHIVKQVIEKVFPTVAGLLTRVMEVDPDVPSETAFEPLLDYIASNMGKLGQALLTQVFLSILEDMWSDCVKMLRKEYESLSHKTSNRPQMSRLKDLVVTLSDFFEAGGSGLDRKQIETEQYLLLLNEVNLAAMSTPEVTRVFLHDLVKQQEEAPQEFGVLRFSHMYQEDEKVLKMTVVSAQGIPALDKTGKSDPFVEIHLLPVDLFHKAAEKHYKTDTKKQTLDPFFNNDFNIPAEGQTLKEDGAVILLAMYDWDRYGKNDFAGVCVVPCKSIPQGSELKMEHLNLFHYKHTVAYRELERRSSEHLAHDFLRMMKKFVFDEEHVPTSPSHSVGRQVKRISLLHKSGHS